MHSLAALLQLTDSALPTGAFSHSFGLESFLVEGDAATEQDLLAWLREYLETQLTLTDAAAIRRVYAGIRVAALDAELTALLASKQVRDASTRMGRRLLEIADDSFPSPGIDEYAQAMKTGECAGHFVVAFALIGMAEAVDEDALVEAYLHSAIASLVANAVRAIPLGQLAGQRVLSAMRGELAAAVASSRAVNDNHFGATSPLLEIQQMRHEHLHARMFAS